MVASFLRMNPNPPSACASSQALYFPKRKPEALGRDVQSRRQHFTSSRRKETPKEPPANCTDTRIAANPPEQHTSRRKPVQEADTTSVRRAQNLPKQAQRNTARLGVPFGRLRPKMLHGCWEKVARRSAQHNTAKHSPLPIQG